MPTDGCIRGIWSATHLLLILSNRVYVGELSFREITSTDCHEPLIDAETFAEAQRITAERSADRGTWRANSSDYDLTGLMRCPTCDTAMIGTRNHGRSKVYRYYLCHNRNRYNTSKCDGHRLDADALESAVLQSLASFYRDQHTLIAAAITEARSEHLSENDTHEAELAAVRAKITDANAKIDRYLTAFENGTMDPTMVGPRLTELRDTCHQLTARRDELITTIAAVPEIPAPATLTEIADHISDLIDSGTDQTRKALIKTLIAQIKITGPDTVVPVFRIPQPSTDPITADTNAANAPTYANGPLPDEKSPVRGPINPVRVDTNSVVLAGIEPATPRV
ncbi:recombinase zinc beta ribbon domain-containing protein [Nocardia tengchongensis]